MNRQDIEQIIYAKDLMEDMKKILIPYYISEYGKKYQELIKRRLENTYFLLTSPPDLTYNKLKDRSSYFFNKSDYDNMILEYLDYEKINGKLKKIKQMQVRELLCQEYGIDADMVRKKDLAIENLAISSYSTNIISLLNCPIVMKPTKNEIFDFQEKYLIQCESLKCKQITDNNVIDSILNKIDTINNDYQISLLKNTLWGKRLYQYFVENNELFFNDKNSFYQQDSLYKMLSEDVFLPKGTMKCANFFYNCGNKQVTNNWICFSMLENVDFDLNHIFFHEMRHAVENGGINLGGHDSINEIRTDVHAKNDVLNLPKLFENSGECKSLYLKLLPLTGDLFFDNQKFFDKIAIANNIELLEKNIDIKLLEMFNYMLNDIIEITLNLFNENIPIYLNIDSINFEEKSKTLSKSIQRNKN